MLALQNYEAVSDLQLYHRTRRYPPRSIPGPDMSTIAWKQIYHSLPGASILLDPFSHVMLVDWSAQLLSRRHAQPRGLNLRFAAC